MKPATTIALFAAILLLPGPLRAQAVTVRVLDAETAAPVVGAVVHLVGEAGTAVERGLTDERGRTLLLGFPAGLYRLRVEMIGMAAAETGPFRVAGDTTVEREVRLESRALDVEGIDVEVEGRCRVRPEEGLVTSRVWEEARKALEASAVTEEQGMYRYRTVLYERDLERDTEVVLDERRSLREATMRTPFRSRPAEELMERGFVRPSGDEVLYFAPDAAVLLSDVFLDRHCFRLTRDREAGERERLIGLAFEPLRLEGDAVDISGTLWLDPSSSELRWLEYRYENLDPEIRSDEIGGRVEFRRMPEGGWIVPRWWIRMPAVAAQRDPRTGLPRRYVAGFREAGGVVLDVEDAGAATVARMGEDAGTGAISGVVRDSLGRPVEGVVVEIAGADRETTTGPDGRYRITGLVEGIYRVRVDHPRLRAHGWEAEPVSRAVFAGSTEWQELRLPSTSAVLREACRSYDSGPDAARLPARATGTGILAGRVVEAGTAEPLPGAVVRVLATRYEVARGSQPRGVLPVYEGRYGFETTADEDGFYRVCGVPERESLTVVGVHGGVETDGVTVRITDTGGVVEQIVEVPRRRR